MTETEVKIVCSKCGHEGVHWWTLDGCNKCLERTPMWFELKGDERITKRCATEGCGGQVTWRLEEDGTGSNYCSGCKARIVMTENEVRYENAALADENKTMIAALKKIAAIEPSYEYGEYSVEANMIATEALKLIVDTGPDK